MKPAVLWDKIRPLIDGGMTIEEAAKKIYDEIDPAPSYGVEALVKKYGRHLAKLRRNGQFLAHGNSLVTQEQEIMLMTAQLMSAMAMTLTTPTTPMTPTTTRRRTTMMTMLTSAPRVDASASCSSGSARSRALGSAAAAAATYGRCRRRWRKAAARCRSWRRGGTRRKAPPGRSCVTHRERRRAAQREFRGKSRPRRKLSTLGAHYSQQVGVREAPPSPG